MKAVLAFLLLAAASILPSAGAPAPSAEQTQRIAASFVLALGRAPSAGELAQWAEAGPLPLTGLIARLRERLASDPAARRATVVRAGEDALGRTPAEDEIARWSDGARTYSELMQGQLAGLAAHPADYAAVVQRAYQFLLRRAPYPTEIDYWNHRPTLSYALLVACLENWARRNQPGLMETRGDATVSANSDFLAAILLSPAVAAEARAAVGLLPAGDAPAPGHHLVAPGAAGIVSAGGIHFAAAGSARLFPARAAGPV